MVIRLLFVVALAGLASCADRKEFTIITDFEEPQNRIARTIAKIVTESTGDSLKICKPSDTVNVISSLLNGTADFGIVDNYYESQKDIRTIIPLFNQVLHLLVRDEAMVSDNSVRGLLTNRKVYAGEKHSSTRKFVEDLMTDYNIEREAVHFVDVLDLFKADVIFSFTDLLTPDELKDLVEYKFYSFDDVADLHNGSLVEGICTRHPEFEPFIINRELYGDFTSSAVVTLSFQSVLAARADVPEETVYEILEAIEKDKSMISSINPLLYNFTTDFDNLHLTFQLHPGSLQYLHRLEPVFIQKYADVFGVIISITVAAASFFYSFQQWKNARKKNKIDVFYGKLMSIRNKIP